MTQFKLIMMIGGCAWLHLGQYKTTTYYISHNLLWVDTTLREIVDCFMNSTENKIKKIIIKLEEIQTKK